MTQYFSIVSFQSGAKPELLGYVTIWNKIQIMRQFRECAFDINASPPKKVEWRCNHQFIFNLLRSDFIVLHGNMMSILLCFCYGLCYIIHDGMKSYMRIMYPTSLAVSCGLLFQSMGK